METLYRFFDADGKLLYVGISNNWTQRLKQHYKDSPFFEQARHITLTHYKTREAVEAAEKLAIETEGPVYNKAYNPDYEDALTHFAKIKAWVYTKLEPDDKHRSMVEELQNLFRVDDLWTGKTAAPIAYYLNSFLPDWDTDYDINCEFCLNLYNSRNIEIWSDYYQRRVQDATN